MGKSAIEWTDKTWNPVVGCARVSEGCRNCYAFAWHDQKHALYLKHGGHWPESGKPMPKQFARPFKEVQLLIDRIEQPLHWRTPCMVFVNSMSDLFHPDVPFTFIDQVFAVMAYCRHHTFQVLTKRPERMKEYVLSRREQLQTDFFNCELGKLVNQVSYWMRDPIFTNARLCLCSTAGRNVPQGQEHLYSPENLLGFPTPNIWLGTSVENQKAADERIPHLIQTPAAVRFLSCEPLLGPVDLIGDMDVPGPAMTHEGGRSWTDHGWEGDGTLAPGVDWVIVGGESGTKARPMHPAWAQSLRDQCQQVGISFFFKQWGEWAPCRDGDWHGLGPVGKPPQGAVSPDGRLVGGFLGDAACSAEAEGWRPMTRLGKKHAGRELDGRTWDEFPEAMR
jgi:protein gp37